ncbi:MAG: ABC transporter permease [Chthoniobacterales bacterium]
MLHDFRFALRQLIKARGFTIAAVTVLAFGIGANTAIFSLLDTMLFQPPSFTKPTEIVQLFSQDKKAPKTFRGFSYPTYLDIRAQNSVFADTMAHNLAIVGIGDQGNTRRTFADIVSASYFNVLGVRPMQGRGFLPEEEKPGANAAVAVVSYNYWQKQALDPAVLGSTITINSRPFTVVGILPKGFTGTMQVFAPEVWVPLGVHDQLVNDFQTEDRKALDDRTGRQLLIIGRLRPGLTAAAAEPALQTLAASLEQAFPVEQKNQTFVTAPLSRFATSTSPSGDGEVKKLAPLLFGMAGVVLLVACLNLANMLLARGTARRKEIAVRLALGASRWRIVRQLLIEGFALAVLGSAFGLLLGLWSSDLLVASMGNMMPVDIVWGGGLNGSVLLATFGFCILGTLAFALGPALKLSRTSVVGDLKEHAGEDAVRRRWKFLPRNPLVVIQIAFSLALLTASALFIRGAGKAASADTGLETTQNFLLELDGSLAGYDQARSQNLYRTLEERLAALPGVERASISATVPFGMVSLDKAVQRGGVDVAPDAKPATAAEGLAFSAHWNSVCTDYFSTVGLRLLRGRTFTTAEAMHQDKARSAIIDDVLAKKLWPEGDALGQQIQFATKDAPRAKGDGSTNVGTVGSGSGEAKQQLEVVGIVPSTRESLFEKNPRGALYLPFAGGFQSNVFFHLKFAPHAARDTAATADLIRRTVRSVDPALPVLSLKTFAQHLDGNIQLWLVRAGAALFSVFGFVAFGLAVVGVYGVKAYSVARRTREIGIRMALGAQRETVQWMILREGFVMLASGVAIGLLLAAGTGQLLSGILYEVGAFDPLAFTLAPLLLAAAALLATWLPARRATRISPMVALRTE